MSRASFSTPFFAPTLHARMADEPDRKASKERGASKGAPGGSGDPAAASASAAEPGFDARLARLEAIVGELEGGGLPLERSIDRYQEGVALLRDCRGILAGFQKRVEELSADPDCEPTPYAHDPDARDDA
jgi:exodeoxyribonuclease VII small subunit